MEAELKVLERMHGNQRVMAASISSVAASVEDLRVRLGGRPAVRGPWNGDGGEFLAALARQTRREGQDPRLVLNASTWAGESVPSAGGFALPADLRDEVMMPVVGAGSLLAAFQPTPTRSDIVRIALDETAEWGTAGITANLIAEGEAITPTKAVLKQVNCPLYRVPAMQHGSGELIGRSPASARFAWRALARKIRNKVEAFILQGSGENQPLGLLNGPALIVLTDVASTATSIAAQDITAMVSRLPAGSFPGAIWICHSSALPSVMACAPLYQGTGGPAGSLASRPVYVSEHCNPLGSRGDLILCDPEGFLYALDGPYETATAEFAFDQGLDSFRATLYMGGVPLLSAPVPRRTGTDTLGHCIVLEGNRS